MARKPNTYWEKRTTELMKQIEKNTEYSINQLIKVYEQATKNINKEINNIFKNFAKDSGLSKESLVQLLNKRETETHYKNLLEVINNNITDESIKKKLLTKYNAPAYSYRISRYQQLQDNIDIELKKLADVENKITKQRYIDTIQDAYYHNIYEIQKGLGIGFSFSEVDMRTINLLLNEKWIDKENFSTRIWNNSEKLSDFLRTQFTADTMTGMSIQKMSRQLADYMNVGLYSATRLVRTEVNHFANESEMLSYEELDIEKYRFIATLDNVTCEHCAELDNKVFNVKDRIPGKNYPPIHANDRCTTVAEFDDETMEELQRRARDENGNPILVPQDMDYQEWKEKYIINSTNTNNSSIINKNNKILSLDECKKLIEYQNIKFWDNDLKQINDKLLSENTQRLNELINKYPKMKEYIKNKNIKFNALNLNNNTVAHVATDIDIKNIEISLSKLKYRDYNDFIKMEDNELLIEHCMDRSDKYKSTYTITHEFGHLIESMFIDEYNRNHLAEFYNMKTRALNAKTIAQSKKIIRDWESKVTDNIAQEIYDIARSNNATFDLNKNLSQYGKENSFEFFAECFANAECGKTNELGKAILQYLKKRGL